MKYFFLALTFISLNTSFSQVNIFKPVNSPLDEQNPVISPDGNTLFITIANHPENIGGRKDPGDIWICKKENDQWAAPKHGGRELNNALYNAVAGLSKDGSELYLLSHYKADGGTPVTQGLSVSTRQSTSWGQPKNISIPYFLNRSGILTGHIYLSDQYEVFVFSAESYGTIGVEDIYLTIKQNGNWLEPTHLGKIINTPFQELSPYISVDGKKLYFASNGREGFGSFDIYETERLDDTWKNWSMPVNIGSSINSKDRELFYRADEAAGISLYTSTKDSDGYGDVKLLIKDQLQPLQPAAKETPVVTLKEDNRYIQVKGKITSAKTGEPVLARLIFKADSSYLAQTLADGSYQNALKRGHNYLVEVSGTGYINLSEKVVLEHLTLNNLELNFKLQPIEIGTTVNLKNVLFEIGTTKLLEESYPELDVVIDFLKENPKVEIELEGHTDNRGDAKKNLVLSQQRVDQIKTYLLNKGISSKRIKGKGFGGSRPIATNDTEEARKLNRRVEFRIIKK